MATLSTIEYNKALPREKRSAASDPNGNPDNYNRPLRQIWEIFQVEHDKAGTHKSGLLAVFSRMEQGKYTGNGADDRTISLSNASLVCMNLKIWSEEKTYTVWSDDFHADLTKDWGATVEYANGIQDMGTGSFQIGSDDSVNKNAIVYYYLAWERKT